MNIRESSIWESPSHWYLTKTLCSHPSDFLWFLSVYCIWWIKSGSQWFQHPHWQRRCYGSSTWLRRRGNRRCRPQPSDKKKWRRLGSEKDGKGIRDSLRKGCITQQPRPWLKSRFLELIAYWSACKGSLTLTGWRSRGQGSTPSSDTALGSSQAEVLGAPHLHAGAAAATAAAAAVGKDTKAGLPGWRPFVEGWKKQKTSKNLFSLLF